MAEREAHKKSLVAIANPDFSVPANTVDLFNTSRFEQAVWEKGYAVYHEQALRCPCSVPGTTAPLSSCLNCGGRGWFFVARRETRMLISSMGSKKDYTFQWSEQNEGTAKITSSVRDKVAHMDRITLLNSMAYHNQALPVQYSQINDLWYMFTAYPPVSVELAYLFLGPAQPLQYIEPDSIVIKNQMLVFPANLFSGLSSPVVQVKYKYQSAYHVIDVLRDIIRTREKRTDTVTPVEVDMPQLSLGRRAHFVFERPDVAGQGVFDNTRYVDQSCHRP